MLNTFKTKNLTIHYDKNFDGGGTWFGQEYIDIVKSRYPNRKFNRCYEWCAGPGFIGLSILDQGLCQSLCLSDMYAPALECAVDAVKDTEYQSKVSTYITDTLVKLPLSEQFDLVVGNPPHYLNFATDDPHQDRIRNDIGWNTHRDFFTNIKSHLTNDGIILLQENQKGSTAEIFESTINTCGLKITSTFNSPNWYNTETGPRIYYIEITHQ